MKNFSFLLIFIVFYSCSSDSMKSRKNIISQNESTLTPKNSSLTWKKYGMIPPYEDELKLSAQKLGFEYEGSSGCLISSKLKYSIDSNNKIVDSILVRKLGNDWQKHWEQLADSIYSSKLIH